MILTRTEIETFAWNAGFRNEDLATAVAVAFAESGGDPRAYDPELAAGAPQNRGSYGVWQIYRNDHPEFDTWNLNDPQVCACAAFLVYKEAGHLFTPWSTWKTGAYRKFLGQPLEIASAAPEPGGVS